MIKSKGLLSLIFTLFIGYTFAASKAVVFDLGDEDFYVVPIKDCDLNELLPKVFYIDDVADSLRPDSPFRNLDPNGVQEIPIVIGWRNIGFYDFVAFGNDSDDDINLDTSFTQNLLSLAGESSLIVKTGGDLENEIISQALDLTCSGELLNIVVGGPWNVVEDAIDRSNCIEPNSISTQFPNGVGIPNCIATPINELIKVIGIGGTNVESNNQGNRTDARDRIKQILGSNAIEIVPEDFIRFLNPDNSFNIDYVAGASWYQQVYHPTRIGDFLLSQKFDKHNIRINYCDFGSVKNQTQWFCNNLIDGSTGYPQNNCDPSLFGGNNGANPPFPPNSCIPSQERFSFRGADFTALAYVKWGESTFSMGDEMYEFIEMGIETLPLKD